MTINKNNYWQWLIPIGVTILISLFTYAFTSGKTSAKVEDCHIEVIDNRNNIDKLDSKKADKEDMDRIFNALDRIESKMDRHLEHHN